MLKKIFRPITIGSATAIITATTLLSYVAGLARDKIIAFHFGTSGETDVYNASFLIPDTLFTFFIAGALTAAFMPVFTDYLGKNKEDAYKIANTVLLGGTLFIGILALILSFFMEGFIDKVAPVLFPNLSSDLWADMIVMTRVMIFSALLFTVSNTLGNILMSYKHFLTYSLSPILYNLGIIAGVVFFADKIGIYSAAVGVIVGAVLHALVRIIDIFFTEYKFSFKLSLSHPGIKKILKLMIPRSISLICWQVNLIVFAVAAGKVIVGGLSAFNFARNIQSFAVSLFGISFATAVFPYLTSAVTDNDKVTYVNHIQKTIQRILFFTIPSMVGLMLLSEPLITLILSGGEFDENSIRLTSLILFFFAFSIPFESLMHILSRAYYAIQDTFTVMTITIITMGLMAVSTYFLTPVFGIEWTSISFSIGLGVQILLLFIFLRKHLHNFDYRSFFLSIFKMIIATGVMALVIILSGKLDPLFTPRILAIIKIIIGAGTFLLTAYLLRSPEISSINYILKRVFKKTSYEKNI